MIQQEAIKFILERIHRAWQIQGCVCSGDGVILAMTAYDDDNLPKAPPESGLIRELYERCQNCSLPVVFMEEDMVYYMAFLDLLTLAFRAQENRKENVIFTYEEDHKLARRIAAESMVLLKNEDAVLPLSKAEKTAFIGPFARKPRFQGGGSSHINCFKINSVIDAAREKGLQVFYAEGCADDGRTDDALLREAVELAKDVDKVVLCVGLTDHIESEGYDRKDMRMPEGHLKLIEEICKVNADTIVVLHNGAPVEIP